MTVSTTPTSEHAMRNSPSGQPFRPSLGAENRSTPYTPRKHAHTAPKTTCVSVRPRRGKERRGGGGEEKQEREREEEAKGGGHDRACRMYVLVETMQKHVQYDLLRRVCGQSSE